MTCKRILLVCGAVFSFFTLFFLTACKHGETITGALSSIVENGQPAESRTCILLGNTRNVPRPNEQSIQKELGPLDSYTVIVLDGKPDAISTEEKIHKPKRFFDKEKNNAAVIQKHVQIILDQIPDDEEIDILKGLDSGRRTLSSCVGKKRLAIFSSGLSTAGALNFVQTPGWIYRTPEEIVEQLQLGNSLPDLSGIEIVWYGFGDVDDEQPALNDLNLYCLKQIWIEILRACHVSDPEHVFDERLRDAKASDESKINYPSVTPVVFPGVIELREDQIGFVPKTTELIDPQAAIDVLTYYADCIRKTTQEYYIVGSTATVSDPESCRILSRDRAEVVKQILCNSFQINEERFRIFPLGQENLGEEFRWRCNDLNPDGSLNEENAQQNRKVMIIDSTSEDGKAFLQQWNENEYRLD